MGLSRSVNIGLRRRHSQVVLWFGTLALSCLAAMTHAAPIKVRVKVALASPTDEGRSRQLETLFVAVVGEPLATSGPREHVGTRTGIIVERTNIGRTVELNLEQGAWVISAFASGYWGDSVEVVLPGSEELTLTLWPAGMITGRVSSSHSLPEDLRMKFTPSNQEDAQKPSGEARCRLSGRSFACAVPTGEFDVRFRAPGFMGIYFWGLTIAEGATLDVGELRCEKGSSIVGFVELETGSAEDLRGTRIELQTLDGKPVVRRSTETEELLSTYPNSRGFWQLKHTPPGEFQVVGSMPGYDDAGLRVHVLPDRETTLRTPLMFSRPRELELYVDPPVDPRGNPWSVTILRQAGYERTELATSTVPADGHLVVTLKEGLHRLVLESETMGNMHTEEFEFHPYADPLYISLRFVRVQGRLRLGKRPLVGTVSFGGTRGGISVHMTSDARGRFEGFLPKPGKWVVEINATAPMLKRFISEVEVIESESGVAQVVIALPDTLLEGVVVDARGERLPRAMVSVFRSQSFERPVVVATDKEGEFQFRALAEDAYTLAAEAIHSKDGPLESDPVTVDFRRRSIHKVTVQVYPKNRIRGRVVSDLGPVPNARILAIPPNGTGVIPETHTDADGRFELLVRRGERSLSTSVSALGFSLRILKLHAGMTSPVEIPLVRNGGTIVVEIAMDAGEDRTLTLSSSFGRLALFREDVGVPLGLLRQWSNVNGGGVDGMSMRMILPQMEAGPYRLCRVDDGISRVNPDRDCSFGLLHFGGELVLRAR